MNDNPFKQSFFVILWFAIFGLTSVLLYQSARPNNLSVRFFDIGQGDAAFIVTPAGRRVLIDTGPDGRLITAKLSGVLPFYDSSIDLLVLTHPDKDHIGGALQVLKEYRVGGVLMPRAEKDKDLFENTVNFLKEKNIPVLIARAGERVRLDKDVAMDILWPPIGGEEVFSSSNDMSLVTRVTYKDDSFLFTGDLEERGERVLEAMGIEASADVLKAGHHGSKTSTSPSFLRSVAPKIAIISVGKNSYGHPNQEVLDLLSGLKILRTDTNGDITLISSGNDF